MRVIQDTGRHTMQRINTMSSEEVEEELMRLSLTAPTVEVIFSRSEWDWVMGMLETMARTPDALDTMQACEVLDHIEALLKEGKV